MNKKEVEEYIIYDPIGGSFERIKCHHSRYLGKIKGNVTQNGYLEICFNGVKMSTHKLAWLLYYGEFPEHYIDHIDGDKQNNRIDNLRKSNPSLNQKNRGRNKNNSTGYNGVYKSGNKFRARVKVNGKLINLGTFDTVEQAAECRMKYNQENGFDINHGVRSSYES